MAIDLFGLAFALIRGKIGMIEGAKEARHAMGVKSGDDLLVVVNDDLTLIMAKPKRYAKASQGLAKGTYPIGYLK